MYRGSKSGGRGSPNRKGVNDTRTVAELMQDVENLADDEDFRLWRKAMQEAQYEEREEDSYEEYRR